MAFMLLNKLGIFRIRWKNGCVIINEVLIKLIDRFRYRNGRYFKRFFSVFCSFSIDAGFNIVHDLLYIRSKSVKGN